MKKKQSAGSGLIVETRNAAQAPEEAPSDLGAEALEACVMELIIAMHLKDVKKAAEALKSAFEVMELQEDKDESSDNSFHAQNLLAGREIK